MQRTWPLGLSHPRPLRPGAIRRPRMVVQHLGAAAANITASGTLDAAAKPHDTNHTSSPAPEGQLLFEQSGVARYAIANAEDKDQLPPKLEGKGELKVNQGALTHGSSGVDDRTWTFVLTPHTEMRWVHSSQWAESNELGCILYAPLTRERYLLIFESIEASATSTFARTFADAVNLSGIYVAEPRPDPPRWAAGVAASMLRGSLKWRESMQYAKRLESNERPASPSGTCATSVSFHLPDDRTCGARTGKGILQRSETKRQLTQPTEAPKKVNPKLRSTVKGVSSVTGKFADAIEGVAAWVGGSLVGLGCASGT